MEDRYGMLHGDGKRMRVLPLDSMPDIELDYYLNAALQLNAWVKTQLRTLRSGSAARFHRGAHL